MNIAAVCPIVVTAYRASQLVNALVSVSTWHTRVPNGHLPIRVHVARLGCAFTSHAASFFPRQLKLAHDQAAVSRRHFLADSFIAPNVDAMIVVDVVDIIH
jgi:hypothetical protein